MAKKGKKYVDSAKLIDRVDKIDDSILACAGGAGSERGTGADDTPETLRALERGLEGNRLRAREAKPSSPHPQREGKGEPTVLLYEGEARAVRACRGEDELHELLGPLGAHAEPGGDGLCHDGITRVREARDEGH